MDITENKTEPKFRFSIRYEWLNPDASLLSNFIKTVLIPGLGEGSRIYASIDRHGPFDTTSEDKFDTFDAWQEEFVKDEIEKDIISIDFQVRSSKTDDYINLSVNFERNEISIWSVVPESILPDRQELIIKIEEELSLKRPIKANRDGKSLVTGKNNLSLRRSYFVPKPSDPKQFIDAFSAIIKKHELKNINGSITYSNPVGLEKTSSIHESWCQEIETQWDNIEKISHRSDNGKLQLSLYWYYLRNILDLSLYDDDDSIITNLIAELENGLNINHQDQKYPRIKLEGGERTFFTRDNVDVHWFKMAVETISSYLSPDSYCNLGIILDKNRPQKFVWQDIHDWEQNVLDNWDNLIEASGYFSGLNMFIDFRFNHKRERVTFEIRAVTQAKAEEVFDKFTEVMNLEAIEGNVYKTPQSSGYFAISSWRNTDFAKALKSIIRQFIKDKYILINANIIEARGDGRNQIQSFNNFSSFISRVEDDRVYDGLYIEIQGPRGAALSVRMSQKRSRLEIKSSVSANEFTNIVDIFKENLGLKKIASSKEAAESAKSGLKDSFWVLLFLPILTTLLVNLLLTEQVKNAPYSRNTLDVISPLKNNDKPTLLPEKEVSIVWHLKHEQWFNIQVMRNVQADIQILDANGSTVEHTPEASPGIKYLLQPGYYQVIVTLNSYGLSEKVSFEIPSTPKS